MVLQRVLIYLHNIYVKIETRGKLEALARAHDARAVDIKFTLRVLTVVVVVLVEVLIVAVVVVVDRYVRQAF